MINNQIAIIADIHSHYPFLKNVLNEISKKNIDNILTTKKHIIGIIFVIFFILSPFNQIII